jgi:peptidyl-prolyl cis-trans isomerase C/peptidyl-prolyl cis-trans isomerase D
MKHFQVLASFLCVTLMLSAAGAQSKDATVAVVGSRTISLDEFNKKYNEIKNQTVNPPTREQFLEDLIRYEVGLQEAEKRKLQNDPIVQERMRQELYKALLEKDLGDKVQKTTVNEKEMEAYYKKNPEIRTSHILIEVKPGATAEQRAEAKKRAGEIYEEVKKSKRPFEELVKLYSDDTLSKATGGDVGWGSRVTWVPAYYDTVLKMKVGEISPLVETQFGFHIIKVTGRRAYENANKRVIRAAVFDEKRRETFNEYFDKLKKNYKIQTNRKLVE